MGDNRLPKRVMSGELENAGKREPGGKEKEEWTDLTLGYGTSQYTKGAVGLWPRG